MFKRCLDVLFCDIFANIIASLACACITFTSDILACLLIFFVFIKSLCCTYGQITIVQFSFDLVFLEARKINFKLITIVQFLNICFHQVCCMMTIQFLLCLVYCSVVCIKRNNIFLQLILHFHCYQQMYLLFLYIITMNLHCSVYNPQ